MASVPFRRIVFSEGHRGPSLPSIYDMMLRDNTEGLPGNPGHGRPVGRVPTGQTIRVSVSSPRRTESDGKSAWAGDFITSHHPKLNAMSELKMQWLKPAGKRGDFLDLSIPLGYNILRSEVIMPV
jgi:hypothetical protein